MAHLQTVNFNCNGIHSSINDIIDFFENIDDCVVFLSEHWLQNHELNDVQTLFKNEGYWSYFKSSVNPEEEPHGRPYGGVGFVCKRQPTNSYSFRPKIIDNDRIAVLQLTSRGNALLNIIGVYLPYFNGRPEQTALYAETLEILQSVIDDCDDAPIIVLGDMNAPLPQAKSVLPQWYKNRPFNHNSLQLYDFMNDNELCVANFAFSQPVNYTYKKGKHRTYIDHVLVPKHFLQNIDKCTIMGSGDIPSSDHLPIVTVITLPTIQTSLGGTDNGVSVKTIPRLDWDSQDTRRLFQQNMSSSLADIGDIPSVQSIINIDDAQHAVDDYCALITSAIHSSSVATANALHQHKSKRRKQPWWTKECTILRDRTRFWRRIWIQCGRCRHSQVFQC